METVKIDNTTLRDGNRNCRLRIIDCGLAGCRETLQLQHELRQKRRADEIANTVLIVEHPAVITLGARRGANKLLIERENLLAKNIDVVDIRRGGGSTAHNPGQLVFYPILNLRSLGLGVSEYVRQLEQMGAELLKQLRVNSRPRKGLVGLWVADRKIASIGVRVSKGISYHGMAINIQNDLSIFEHIVPCGLDGVVMTSVLKETSGENSGENIEYRISNNEIKTGQGFSMKDVKQKLAKLCVKYWSSEDMVEYESCS